MCASARFLHTRTAFGTISAIESRLYSPEVITVSEDGTGSRWHLPFLIVMGLELASEPPAADLVYLDGVAWLLPIRC
jgi:hypothetical protein